jgi:hypothetical protein
MSHQLSTLRMAYLSRDFNGSAVLHCVAPLRVKSLAMQSTHTQAKAGSEDQGKKRTRSAKKEKGAAMTDKACPSAVW